MTAAKAPDAAPATPAVADQARLPAQPSKACMIAGEFNLLGTVVRSRDCVQSTGASSHAELTKLCQGLARTSAQMGGQAGTITYLDACPAPAQGRCAGLFGLAFDGYYYERSADNLAGLPASCSQGGGRWSED